MGGMDDEFELTAGARALAKAVKKHAAGSDGRLGVNSFGRLIGCTSGMVSKWIRGATVPSIRWRAVLEDKVGIPVMAWGFDRRSASKKAA